jgi:hypothetical protein
MTLVPLCWVLVFGLLGLDQYWSVHDQKLHRNIDQYFLYSNVLFFSTLLTVSYLCMCKKSCNLLHHLLRCQIDSINKDLSWYVKV